MKVYVEYQFREGPYGGANQFLKNLKEYFIKSGIYTENMREADVILINHVTVSKEVINLKRECPDKVFIHRMDGPVSKHRPRAKWIDWQSIFLDRILCDATVFQSQWTKDSCVQLGYNERNCYAIIHNAPNEEIFFKRERKFENEKVKLVSTSWSANWNKGFHVLQYLDQKLDFEKYECTFIGRSPVEFQNIRVMPPMDSTKLAEELAKQDIFLAISKNESCSNSLIEAMNTGLVVVGVESGCYQEIVRDGGVLVQNYKDILTAIDNVLTNYEAYREKLPYYSMDSIGQQYYNFICRVLENIQCGNQCAKKMTLYKLGVWKCICVFMKFYTKMNGIIERRIKKDGKYC